MYAHIQHIHQPRPSLWAGSRRTPIPTDCKDPREGKGVAVLRLPFVCNQPFRGMASAAVCCMAAVWLLYAVCCILYSSQNHKRGQLYGRHTAFFLLYCCMVCCMECLAVWHVWYVCGPHIGQLARSMVVLDACMRPKTRFRHTVRPIAAMVGVGYS